MAAILAAHIWAPGAVSAVVSVAGAIVTLLIQGSKDPPDPPPPPAGPPDLKIVSGIAAAFFMLAVGCASTLGPVDYAELAKVQVQIEECKAAGRDAGTYAAYDACMKDAGLHAR